MSDNGPKWYVEAARSSGLYYVVREGYAPGEVPVAIVLADEREGVNALAYAYLMAAAPNMLEAIEYVISILDQNCDSQVKAHEMVNFARNKAKNIQS